MFTVRPYVEQFTCKVSAHTSVRSISFIDGIQCKYECRFTVVVPMHDIHVRAEQRRSLATLLCMRKS